MKRYVDSIIADLLRRFNLNPSNNMGTNNLDFINEYRETGFYYTKLREHIEYLENLIKHQSTYMLDIPEGEFEQPFLLFILNADGELEVYKYFQHEEDEECYGFSYKQTISLDRDDLIDEFPEKYLVLVQSDIRNRRYKLVSKDNMISLLNND